MTATEEILLPAGYDPVSVYRNVCGDNASFISECGARHGNEEGFSLVGLNPVLELSGKEDRCVVSLRQERGGTHFDFLRDAFRPDTHTVTDTRLEIIMPPERGENIILPVRSLLAKFGSQENPCAGLYGAFSYECAYLFEDIKRKHPSMTPDFRLFLFDTFIRFTPATKKCTVICSRESREDALRTVREIGECIRKAPENPQPKPFRVHDMEATPSDKSFIQQVEFARELFEQGELMEMVLSRRISGKAEGDPLTLYRHYSRINPSPYMFYYDFGDEVLTGTSPEMMVQCIGNKARIRPISGTIRSAGNPVDEHALSMKLLNSAKEKSELDMLVDLARNDLARVCKPGVRIDKYRILERYSHLIHTVAEVSGELEDGKTGLDALIASLNAGTLTGAPKIAAMKYIEETELHAREYYGGAVGSLLLNGDVNTAITIRTAHIRDGMFSHCSGATLLYESDPERELEEVKLKSAGILAALDLSSNVLTAEETV